MIVGRLEGATIPGNHPVVIANIPGAAARAHRLVAGMRFPQIMVTPAQRELDGFVALLESLGVRVRRPEPVDHRRRFGPPALPLGTAYAVWTGIGAIGTAALGVIRLGESRNPWRLLSLGLVVLGTIGLRLTG